MDVLTQNSNYIVLAITLIIWLGLFLYMLSVDKKLKIVETSNVFTNLSSNFEATPEHNEKETKSKYIEEGDIGFVAILFFFFLPIIGLIFSAVWYRSNSRKSKQALKISLTAIIFFTIIRVFTTFLF